MFALPNHSWNHEGRSGLPSHAVLTLAGPARLDGTRPTRVDAAVRGAKSVPSETECPATAQGRHESSMSGIFVMGAKPELAKTYFVRVNVVPKCQCPSGEQNRSPARHPHLLVMNLFFSLNLH
jgi:hypothetical protein